MKFLIAISIVILSCSGIQNNVFLDKSELSGKVVKIVDGDTFDLLINEDSIIRIRMNGIDCPERKQDFYQAAKDALSEYIFKKKVTLVKFSKDRNKRIIANVFCNGENINLMMIQNGYAWHYKKYYSDSTFANAENRARKVKKGLWQITNAIAPWDYRRK